MTRKSLARVGICVVVSALVCGCASMEKGHRAEAQIRSVLGGWGDALKAKNIDQIMAFYSENYTSEGRNKAALKDMVKGAIENDSYEDIVANGSLLAHVHVATVPNRLAPGAEECDLAQFFAALEESGYTGRVSIEATIKDPSGDLPRALAMMKSLAR